MVGRNLKPKHTRKVSVRYQQTSGKQGNRGREKKTTFVLVVIALVSGIASIGYGIIGLHISDDSRASFDPPILSGIVHSTQNSTGANDNSNESIEGERINQESQHTKKGPRLFFKYDAAGPKEIPGTARSHTLPNAVPLSNTIPVEYAEDMSYHIRQRKNTSMPGSFIKRKEWGKMARYNWNHTYHDDFRTLYLYNPSILPLHNTISRNNTDLSTEQNDYFDDPDALSEADLLALTGGDPSVRYLVSFRAYLGCNCFGRSNRTMMTAGDQISYLAIALLDESLDVVEGTDVLIDLNAGPTRGEYERQFAEDCRLFLARGDIFLTCNEHIRHVRITRTPAKKDIKTFSSSAPSQSRTVPPPGYGTPTGIRIPYTYPNIHGDGLNVTLLSYHFKIGGGKNFNLFRATCQDFETKKSTKSKSGGSSTQIYEYFVQTLPYPHEFRKIHFIDGDDRLYFSFNEPVYCEKEEDDTLPVLPKPTFDTPDTFHNITMCPKKGETNCTDPIERSFWEFEGDHGTACCVRVFLPQDEEKEKDDKLQNTEDKHSRGKEVMVGISHKKLSSRNNFWLNDIHKRYVHFGRDRFVSRFVAYDIEYPFDIVAVSGWFCLGFPSDPVELSHPQRSTLAGKNLEFQLDIFDDLYDCPIIHFASGFSEVVGNSSRAIIGYGVNDCHPRMFVLDKDEIVRMLTTG